MSVILTLNKGLLLQDHAAQSSNWMAHKLGHRCHFLFKQLRQIGLVIDDLIPVSGADNQVVSILQSGFYFMPERLFWES